METKKDYKKIAMVKHKEWQGKIEIKSRVPVNDLEDLSIAYTPGVAAPCLAIRDDESLSYEYTRRWNTVAVVTDGTAVLGLGDIGGIAGMPVMEGKCLLFKEFGDVDAIPLCIKTKNVDEIVRTIELLSGSFGGINLEDIAAPRCFEIEKRLKEVCDIPIFHDDQHGTAIVVLAGIINAMKIVSKQAENVKVAISGAGAAATSVAKLLLSYGFINVVVCDKTGILSKDEQQENQSLTELASITNPNFEKGNLSDAMKNADIFIGLSAPNIVSLEMVKSMNKDAIVFAMANPDPEILPEIAISGGAKIVATGRSDYPNQINNVLAFPGVFRGTLDVRASDINEEMKVAASLALAEMVSSDDLGTEYILPKAFESGIAEKMGKAVADAAVKSGVARK